MQQWSQWSQSVHFKIIRHPTPLFVSQCTFLLFSTLKVATSTYFTRLENCVQEYVQGHFNQKVYDVLLRASEECVFIPSVHFKIMARPVYSLLPTDHQAEWQQCHCHRCLASILLNLAICSWRTNNPEVESELTWVNQSCCLFFMLPQFFNFLISTNLQLLPAVWYLVNIRCNVLIWNMADFDLFIVSTVA